MVDKIRNRFAALPDEIAQTCEVLSAVGRVPEQLKLEWGRSNGFITNFIEFYSTAIIGERNLEYETTEFCPGFLVVANDFGSRVALIDTKVDYGNVFLSHAGTMTVESFEDTGMNLETWIDNDCRLEVRSFPEISPSAKVCLVLTSLPRSGLKQLLRIRNLTNLALGISELKNVESKLPLVLCQTSYIKALRLADQINQSESCVSIWTNSKEKVPLSLTNPFD